LNIEGWRGIIEKHKIGGFIMNFTIIIGTSVIMLLVVRIMVVLLYGCLKKVFKLPDSSMGFNLILSIAFYIMYLQGFLGAVEGVMGKNNITNLEWYLIYTFMGISAMLWCYFSWDIGWKVKPQFAKEGFYVPIKKVIVFSTVMVFVFYHGYTQLNTNFGGSFDEEKQMLTMVVNITMISGIIAFDRVLNQIAIICKKWKENKKKKAKKDE